MLLVGNSFQIPYSWKPDVPLQLLKRRELHVSLNFSSSTVQPVSPFLPSCHIPEMIMEVRSKETVRVRDKISLEKVECGGPHWKEERVGGHRGRTESKRGGVRDRGRMHFKIHAPLTP